MAEMRNETDPIRAQIQSARNETIAIFVAEPFDEAAYDRHVNKIDELRIQMAKRMAANMKEIAKELPAEQRKTLARAFERPPRPR
jgi:Spy/CpxP family protein refolding chaperone